MTAPRNVVATAEAVRSGAVHASAVVSAAFKRLRDRNPALNAFVWTGEEMALEAAHAVDGTIAAGNDAGSLAGVPFGVKDLDDCAGMPTSYGSLLFKGR